MVEKKKKTQPKKLKAPHNVWRPAFLDALGKTANVTLACQLAGIHRNAAYNAKYRSKEFSDAWEAAIEEAVDLLEASARSRAMGIDEPVYYQGKQVDTIKRYSDTLTMFLLKAHRPEKFRDNVQVEHSGEIDGGAPSKIELVVVPTSKGVEGDDGSKEDKDEI